MIKLVIVDDDTIIREGLRMIMETQDDLEIVGICSNGKDAIKVCREQIPDVVLLDIRMPEMSGIEVAKVVLEENIGKPLLLTTFDEPDLMIQAVKTNVSGYILKSSPAKTILSAIRTVSCGGTVFEKEVIDYISSNLGMTTVKSKLFDELTDREYDVARLISQGLSNKEIGEKLFISDGTVRNHITSILSKTSLEHRTQIAIQFLSSSH
ncbi:MAG: response regulator transcription factor [Clostridiales bacterium]|nr:response regulator transcription factor [Clostridiales bacterium]